MLETVPPPAGRSDLTRTVFAVLLMLTLIGGAFYILRPFLLSMIWAMTIVVATWPLMLMLQVRLRRRGLAVAAMTGAIVLVFVVPLLLMVQTLVEHADTIIGWMGSLSTATIPPPPDWVTRLPVGGAKIARYWTDVAAAGTPQLAERLAPYASYAAQWLAGVAGSVGLLGIQFLLTIVMTVILYSRGEAARDALIKFGRRLAGRPGEDAVLLAGQAIRAVALGVVVTALVQAALAGIGLGVAGVPFAGLLTAVILLFCIAQIGPLIVLLPAVIWLFWHGHTGSGSALLVWSLIVGTLDNVLRAILIRRGANLPLLLIFAGVIGGLIAFGIVGLFVGPVVLAVAYTLLKQWVEEGQATATP